MLKYMHMIRRLPRKLKKELKKKGLDPTLYLKELQVYKMRDKHLARIFNKDYNESHKIIQEEIGLDVAICDELNEDSNTNTLS